MYNVINLKFTILVANTDAAIVPVAKFRWISLSHTHTTHTVMLMLPTVWKKSSCLILTTTFTIRDMLRCRTK